MPKKKRSGSADSVLTRVTTEETEGRFGKDAYVLGKRCKVKKGSQNLYGTVEFYGGTTFSNGVWVGVRLTKPHGKNNGTVKGEQYFSCKPYFGLFVREGNVHLVLEGKLIPIKRYLAQMERASSESSNSEDRSSNTETSFSSESESSTDSADRKRRLRRKLRARRKDRKKKAGTSSSSESESSTDSVDRKRRARRKGRKKQAETSSSSKEGMNEPEKIVESKEEVEMALIMKMQYGEPEEFSLLTFRDLSASSWSEWRKMYVLGENYFSVEKKAQWSLFNRRRKAVEKHLRDMTTHSNPMANSRGQKSKSPTKAEDREGRRNTWGTSLKAKIKLASKKRKSLPTQVKRPKKNKPPRPAAPWFFIDRLKKKKSLNKFLCFVFSFGAFVFLVICLPLMYSYVGTEELGLRINKYSGAVIEKKAYWSGRYWHGMSETFITYTRIASNITMAIEGAAYSDREMSPKRSIGQDAKDLRGPITIRATGGEMYDVEITMLYKPDQKKLYDIHVYFGGPEQLTLSLTDGLRALARDRLSRFPMSTVLNNRASLVVELRNEADALLKKHHLILVNLHMGRILTEHTANDRLLKQQVTKKKVMVEESRRDLYNITTYSKLLLNAEKGMHRSALESVRIKGEISLLTQERELKLILENVSHTVERQKTKVGLDTAVFEREREIKLINTTLLKIIEEEEMLRQVASVDAGLNESEAAHLTEMRKIAAHSKYLAQLNISMAQYAARLALINEKSAYFQSAKNTIGMVQSDFVLEEWTKMMEKETSALEDIINPPNYRDVQLPEMLDMAANRSST